MISFPATVLGTAVERLIKFDVWINRRTFVNLGRSKFEFSSAHEKYGVWNWDRELFCDNHVNWILSL